MKRSTKRKVTTTKAVNPALAPELLSARISRLGDCFTATARAVRGLAERIAALEQDLAIVSARLDAAADYVLPRVDALVKRANKTAAGETTVPAKNPSIKKRRVQNT